jgi:UDP-N-acetyl-D-mannosaminuronic acid dehydrogenase
MSERLREILKYKGDIRRIGVIGMGYVGIPSAALFADVSHYERVYGFQRDSPTSGYKIEMLNRGEIPLKGEEPGLGELLSKVVAAGKFSCTPDFSKIGGLDAVTIAIQTPFRDPKDLIPDFGPMEDGLKKTGKYMDKGTLVVLESTITPGTTQGWAREILESESGMMAGEDFALAHAPERVMVGRLIRNIREHDRIVGGIDEASTKRAIELYSPLLTSGKIIPMSATAAEVTKTAENTFRDLQIAAVNELALYCEAMGVNVYDVREGIASLKEEGVTRAILWPGPGVGGHCLTKDTYHLERGVRTLGGNGLDYPEGRESLYTLARAVNDFMPMHMSNLTRSALERAGKDLKRTKIAILGWAFLANSDDARNTPSETFRDIMLAEGADIKVHDPYVEEYPGVEIIQELDTVFDGADALAIFTAHRQYYSQDPRELLNTVSKNHPVIVDGRNVIDPDRFIAEGWIYKGIGRGDKNSHTIVEKRFGR